MFRRITDYHLKGVEYDSLCNYDCSVTFGKSGFRYQNYYRSILTNFYLSSFFNEKFGTVRRGTKTFISRLRVR